MLWFLSIAAKRGFRVDRYADAAVGVVERDVDGRQWMPVVTLRPDVTFSGDRRPSRDEVIELHHAAHGECFLAHSVRSEVRCEPVVPAE